MSFSDAIKKAKVASAATAEADKVRDEGGQQAQATTFQLSKTQHVVPRRDNEKGGEAHVASERRAEGEEDEEVELRAWVVRLYIRLPLPLLVLSFFFFWFPLVSVWSKVG
jgi:hypothetical protein